MSEADHKEKTRTACVRCWRRPCVFWSHWEGRRFLAEGISHHAAREYPGATWCI